MSSQKKSSTKNFSARIKIALQYAMPKHAISRLVGKLAAAKMGWLTTKLINSFINAYNINMSEAKLKNARDFATFNDFFTRELAEGARTIEPNADTLCYPVDGAISQQGDIVEGKLIQAKGFDYSLTSLLGGDARTAAPLREMIYVPGELFSVNPLTANNVPDLFARNERVVTIFDTAHGALAMVLVGATIVASIETTWAGTITPPAGKDIFRWQYPATGVDVIRFEKGDEMGRFKLGSTVVSTFAPNMIEFSPDAAPETVTKLGEHYASLIPTTDT